MEYRQSSQYLMPAVRTVSELNGYDVYPSYEIGYGKISGGIPELALEFSKYNLVLIDGYGGVFFDDIRYELEKALSEINGNAFRWISTSEFIHNEEKINELITPFTGGRDPLFGKRCYLELQDFFSELPDLSRMRSSDQLQLIIYGIGASLFSQEGLLVYLDLPKNEIQYRSRAGSVTNLGSRLTADPKSMYKRFYFVDWPVLNNHKKSIIERIGIIADSQRMSGLTWMKGDDFRLALSKMSTSVLRARPWFEPGPWGGSWIKEKIHGVNPDVPNYAWSFELITPENGLIIESSGLLLEFSFDFIMYWSGKEILGNSHARFGDNFPIRFDFLDTFGGGNLSIQCHPEPVYILNEFGEPYTQEETYYILDSKDGAGVYLGFREDIDKELFRDTLEKSFSMNLPVEMENFVSFHLTHKHDLFLIPYGTVHGSGKDNMVLEISSTPYIFTFKMYDWLRPDLDGRPRPLNIKRAMDNLDFGRKGEFVSSELISKPLLIYEGEGYSLYHLPTHQSHFYDIYRYHITKAAEIITSGKFYVLSVVEGDCIIVRTNGVDEKKFRYAETFIIPAAAGRVELVNGSSGTVIVIAAFVK